MLLVAIETSTQQASVAVGTQDGVLAEALLVRPRRHAEFCLPALDFCLREAGVTIRQVFGVVVDVGPGLYTGMRVGLATARGLARAAQIPMCGLASLDVLAFSARHSRRTIVPVIDARRGEVYFALYRSAPGGVQRIGDHRVGAPDALAAELVGADHDVLLVGDGAQLYRDVFEAHGSAEYGDSLNRYPSASALLELSVPRFQREEFSRPETIMPLYLRRPDAEIKWGAA